MRKAAILVLLLAAFQSCKHEPLVFEGPIPLPSGSTEISFQDEVLPLMISNCAMSGCHDPATRAEGIVLNDYASIRNEVKSGNPGDSELYEVIVESDPDKRMPPPPRAALTTSQTEIIRKWIEEGARNTFRSDGACDTNAVSFSTTVKPIIDQYCVGCHGATNPSANLNLTTFTAINQNKSSIYDRISRSKTDPLYMPQGGNLPDCKTNQIKAWIHQGSPQN